MTNTIVIFVLIAGILGSQYKVNQALITNNSVEAIRYNNGMLICAILLALFLILEISRYTV